MRSLSKTKECFWTLKQCKQLNISFGGDVGEWGFDLYGKLCPQQWVQFVPWVMQTASGCQLLLNSTVSQLQTEKENWIKWNVTLSRIPWWDRRSESCNPGVQRRIENMTWILLACALPGSVNEGVNAKIGCYWVVTDVSSLSSLAPCTLQHIIYVTMHFDPTLFPVSHHH